MDPNETLKNWLEYAERLDDQTQALTEWLDGDGFAPRVKLRAVLEGEGREYEGPWGEGVISKVTNHSLMFIPDKGIPRPLVFTGMKEFALQDKMTGKLVRVEIVG